MTFYFLTKMIIVNDIKEGKAVTNVTVQISSLFTKALLFDTAIKIIRQLVSQKKINTNGLPYTFTAENTQIIIAPETDDYIDNLLNTIKNLSSPPVNLAVEGTEVEKDKRSLT